jgi:hypothetical protein
METTHGLDKVTQIGKIEVSEFTNQFKKNRYCSYGRWQKNYQDKYHRHLEADEHSLIEHEQSSSM